MLYFTAKTLIALLTLSTPLFSFEKLHEKYLVNFGNPEAPLKITEYYSFHCPHCIALFRKDFGKIQKSYLDSDQIYWTFHPIPNDLVTLQGMICLEKLNDRQKQMFLEAILEETDISNAEITSALMKKAMEILENPVPNLQSDEFLEKSAAITDAFVFLKQKEQINAVPTVEVNSIIYPKDVPDFEFIQAVVKKEESK